MIILQIILGFGVLGIVGFGLFWLGVIFKAGPEATKNAINKDPRI